MLAPKKVKWRKMQKGRRKGSTRRPGTTIAAQKGEKGRGRRRGGGRGPAGRGAALALGAFGPAPLDPEVAEGEHRPAPGGPLPPALLHLAPLDLFRGEHVGRGSDAE